MPKPIPSLPLNDAQWTELEHIVERFEQSWRSGKRLSEKKSKDLRHFLFLFRIVEVW